MKRILMVALLAAISPGSWAASLEEAAYETGYVLGLSIHCDEPQAERYGKLAGLALELGAPDRGQHRAALQLFAQAATLGTEYGPGGGSCQVFHGRFARSLEYLEQRLCAEGLAEPERLARWVE